MFIVALDPPKDINELRQFLGLVVFFIGNSFLSLQTLQPVHKTMLQKGATFQWMEQCNNAFKLLKYELVKMPTLQYLTHLNCLQMPPSTATQSFCIKKRCPRHQLQRPI